MNTLGLTRTADRKTLYRGALMRATTGFYEGDYTAMDASAHPIIQCYRRLFPIGTPQITSDNIQLSAVILPSPLPAGGAE